MIVDLIVQVLLYYKTIVEYKSTLKNLMPQKL